MATEDLTTYTETDIEGRLTVTVPTCTFTNLQKDETARCFDDKGASHFDGDFEHLLEVKCTACDGAATLFFWSMQLVEDTIRGAQIASSSLLGLELFGFGVNDPGLVLVEIDGGTFYSDSWSGAVVNTSYYLTLKRDESVGTYGTFYCYIYSDASRETLVDTLTITLHSSKKDFRYIYATNGYEDPGNQEGSGYSKDLDLQEGAPPATTVSTMLGASIAGSGAIIGG